MNDDPAALNRKVDLPGAAVQRADRRHAAGVDREVERENPRDVAHVSVHHEAGDLAMPRLGGHQVSEHRVHPGPTRIDDHNVVRRREVEGFVHHQVVAGKHLHGAGRAEDAQLGSGDVPDRGAHRVEAIHQIRDHRRLELPEPRHQRGVRAADMAPHPEPRTRIQLGCHRLAHHGCHLPYVSRGARRACGPEGPESESSKDGATRPAGPVAITPLEWRDASWRLCNTCRRLE